MLQESFVTPKISQQNNRLYFVIVIYILLSHIIQGWHKGLGRWAWGVVRVSGGIGDRRGVGLGYRKGLG
jgi:hypothetical protein